MKVLLGLFFSVLSTQAAKIGSYLDTNCSIPITTFFAFSDVCTWGTDKYNGAFSITLPQCSNTSLVVDIFNATVAPTCQGDKPVITFSASESCTPVQDFFVKADNMTCVSDNTMYNVLAHFTENCTDGGLAFSISASNPPCQADSFAPGLLSYDTSTAYMDPFYMLTLYETNNGTCNNGLTIFMTESFPAQCLKPTVPYHDMAIDIYNAFPM